MLPKLFHMKPEPAEPYTKLAPIYDYVMRHVDYPLWADYLTLLFKTAAVQVESILDIACGTGSLALELKKRGYRVSGLDYSPQMIAVAKAKRPDTHFWSGDMRNFACLTTFDAIVCLFDSINYLMHLNELGMVFKAVKDNLRKGGLFVFDLCTEKNSIKNFSNYYEKETKNNFSFSRRSYYDRKERIQYNDFKIGFRAEGWKKYQELHQQKIYKLQEVKAEISKSELTLRYLFSGFTLDEGSENSNRVHFVLQKLH